MSIPVLTQVYDEVRRLSIAGSVVAPGDFRLKKLLPALEQAGKKAPVFAKVAQAVTGVVESTEKTSAQSLLDLSTLVNAILYTQGETGLPGEMAPIETLDLGQRQTQVSAQLLKPLLEALSTTGSGRMRVVQEAFEAGAFSDLRLVRPAFDAIDDPSADIAEFISEKVLPGYGKAILGELRAKFDPKGRGGQVRRLGLLHRLDPEGSREIVQRAIDDGSQEVRIAAIGCLGGSSSDLALLLEQTKSKAERVRHAAFRSLCRSDDVAAIKTLCDAIRGNDLELVAYSVQSNMNSVLLECIIDESQANWESLLAGKEKDKVKLGGKVGRMQWLLKCFSRRVDKKTEKFLLGAFADRDRVAKIKAEPSGKDVVGALITEMSFGPKNVQRALVDAHSSLDDQTLEFAFRAAVRLCAPAEVFDLFSPYLGVPVDEKKKKTDSASMKSEEIRWELIHGAYWKKPGGPTVSFHGDVLYELDRRWIDLAVEHEDVKLIRALGFPGYSGANEFLATTFQKKLKRASDNVSELWDLLSAMVRVRHPDATDSVVVLLQRLRPSIAADLIPELPKESLPRLEALLPTFAEEDVAVVLRYVTELKNRP